jgi:four helix bundle protein
MMGREYHFRNLILWQRAQELAHEVIALTKRMPQSWATAVMARQIIASATSVGANIAEGHGRFSVGAHRNHLSIARGSNAETDSWLDLLRREGVITEAEEQLLHERCDELNAMLTAKMRALDSQDQQGRRIKEGNEQYEGHAPDEPPFPYQPEDYLS